MTPPYGKTVKTAIRIYLHHKDGKSGFIPQNKALWTACERFYNQLSKGEQVLCSALFGAGKSMGEAVTDVAEKYHAPVGMVWKAAINFEKRLAKEMELI